MWPTAIITICKYLIGSWWCVSTSILCPSGRSVKSKFQVYIYASYECLTLRIYSSITRLESQNRKFPPILIITGPKNDHFFVCKQTRFVDQGSEILQTWLWLEYRVIDCGLSRVESFCEKRDSSRVRVTKNRVSSWVIDSSHAITAHCTLHSHEARILEIQ